MKQALTYSGVLVSALILALRFSQASPAAGPDSGPSHTVVAASGSAAPAGGHYAAFSAVSLNARNQIAFDATLGGPSTSGVFVRNGGTTSTIALGGDPDPAAANFGFVSNSFIVPHGSVVFDANFGDTFRHDRRVTVPLARNGDPAPGGGTGTPLARAANARGAIAYLASVSGATATQGIFRTDGSNSAAIVRDDSVAPTGGTFLSFFTPAVNDRGEVAFMAEMSGGPADFAIFRGDGDNLVPIFVANQIAPGGSPFQDFSDPLINRHGQVAAVGLLGAGVSRSGIFLSDGTNPIAIALDGEPAPSGGRYSQSFAQPLTLNDRGEVAFNAGLTGGSNARGIFRGNGDYTTVLALTGTIAPGTTGTFLSFGDLKLGDDGQVAFIGTLTPGIGGVDLSNNMGIWIGSSESDLRLVVRTGQTIAGNVLAKLPIRLGQLDMNDNGIVWIGGFTSRATAVVFSRTRDRNEHGRELD